MVDRATEGCVKTPVHIDFPFRNILYGNLPAAQCLVFFLFVRTRPTTPDLKINLASGLAANLINLTNAVRCTVSMCIVISYKCTVHCAQGRINLKAKQSLLTTLKNVCLPFTWIILFINHQLWPDICRCRRRRRFVACPTIKRSNKYKTNHLSS